MKEHSLDNVLRDTHPSNPRIGTQWAIIFNETLFSIS